ncbi:MAG TPA: transporter substrate-binding domain-containing protein, partial [Balneolaceae bacterium]|nr:transporter substrate-binding domain-containing protein [Balneolaceae bacterium]
MAIIKKSIEMKKGYSINIILVLCFLLFSLPLSGNAQENAEADFTIGVAGTPPFVTGINSEEGISVEIWRKLSTDIGLTYKSKTFQSVPGAIEALKEGKIDAVVGPVSITSERAEALTFTQPYFQTSLAIMSRVEEPSLWDRIRPFFNTKFFIAVCSFVFI